jgi:serine/threonine-protein kinase
LGDARDFQQRRVQLYLGFLGVLFSAFYVVDGAERVVTSGVEGLKSPGLVAHLAVVITIIGAWLWVRTREHSSAVLSMVEMSITLAISGVAIAVLRTIPEGTTPAGPMMAMTLMLVARAALVPSTGMRTGLVGVLVTGITISGYYSRAADPEFGTFVLSWMIAFTFASSFVSRVIYGLQEQVRQARQLGQYVLEERLGAGGMGVVYRASHRLLRRPTAIKLMSPDRTTPQDATRFEHEVRQTARLTHPNTITIYDYGRSSEGIFYYAMELLDGSTLDTIVSRCGPLPAARVARVLAATAGALAEAHSIQLIHRDIKPANVMLCEQGGDVDVVKVLDFGLVKDLTSGVELTREGSLTGTPAFMSPETIQDPQSVGPRSDLYAVGAVGYYLLTGVHVFEGKTIVEICGHHLLTEPVAPSLRTRHRYPPELEALLLKCLSKDPAARPASALELRRALLELPGLGGWRENDAHAWWAEHRVRLRASDAAATSELSATLAVDLSRRS